MNSPSVKANRDVSLIERIPPINLRYQLSPTELVEEALENKEGQLTSTGALMCDTGQFTGRSPKDRYLVKDAITENEVWWGDINQPFDPDKFDSLQQRMVKELQNKKVYVRDAYACAESAYQLNIRVFTTQAWHNLFCYNMFLRPTESELQAFVPEFTIIHIPEFKANPETDGTRQENFAIINLKKNMILIGGTGYAGEIKKGIFSVLNFRLPLREKVLSMHCSANQGKKGDTALFFGLSGTGKTTLSADPDRNLIGDDEHGWAEDSIFNFEGGCYAKVIDLTHKKEPEIYDAIRYGAIVENTRFHTGTREVDYANISVTQNTRTSYPIHHIDNALTPSTGSIPNNIFFLTCDAFGVLPPISRLSKGQAMYHFISGYTAKVAGTEEGVKEPQTTFSACFGAPFLPLHPTVYARMLGEKMDESQVNIWLVNTGWSGGAYGVGERIRLSYTRAMITAALNGDLNQVGFRKHTIFGVEIPNSCPGVPHKVLSPRVMWNDDEVFYQTSNRLAQAFIDNFAQYQEYADDEIMSGAPHLHNE
ncbi:phosphoenolpyruvate carboxykinase (ATP) [Tunicatimonas pelagia]|uniref:phosphoenolpyruvate carboxykinase (ATP) n=1 Tax=Tunicatimonas pelagia TaxID=931531 RepID=UPI002666FE3E|nr:phosphoenolpyruvate carboxykinase (ATP) [Tunicatimonas pelagia]WKN43053.1 phosphoenolpyruvate carboxykinase (ATP) [Tunicatimonas pelagia]